MSYYRTCPRCGAHLDPGERCDCLEEKRARATRLIAPLTVGEKLHLLELLKNIPASAANTDGGKAEQRFATVCSVPNDTRETEELQA